MVPHDSVPDVFPVIRCGDFTLRAIEPRDAQAWFGYLSDPEVTALTSYDITTIDQVDTMIAQLVGRFRDKTSLRWAIADARDALIGTCGYLWFEGHRTEIGYDLSRQYWGHAIMPAAVTAMLDWGAEHLRLHRVEATVMVGNLRSARVLEKLGFLREGTLRDYKLVRGEYRDFWMYARIAAVSPRR
jgi:ribosomal-protein-alanine N-acetyltransferase